MGSLDDSKIKLSLVIPCYNEGKNIELLINRVKETFLDCDQEIIFVDNGSNDSTELIFKKLLKEISNCRYIKIEKNIGYGNGILQGLLSAKGDVLAWTHADMQTDPKDVLIGYKLFKKSGSEIFLKGRRIGRPLSDLFFTIGMSLFESILLGKNMWDINAQPTMFSRKFFLSWRYPPNDFSLDLYAYYQAKLQNINVIKFPVFFGKRLYGLSHWNINWSSKWKFIKRTILFSLKLRKGI